MTIKLFAGSLTVILITVLIQFATRHYKDLLIAFIVLCIIGTLYILIFVPEAPLWLFSMGRFRDTRKSLSSVAAQNFVDKVKGRKYDEFKFVREVK